ncbi:MAG: outer membrane lipoprotein carrier protein LolA [Bacteroidetes bacterium]|nr:outer membrane lipoprotein carrier protein LolA [Bacteroidota bacterium]
MIKHYNCLLFVLLFSWLAPAGAQNYTPVKNLVAFKSLFSSKSAAINSLKSDFVQEKSISMLENKIISEGSFIYRKSNRLRLEYRKPYTFLFIMDNDRVTIKNSQQTSSVSASSNKLYKMISQLTINCVTGNVLNSKEFDVDVFENARAYFLVLKPRQNMLKSLFDRINIFISKNDFTVDRLELMETSGDKTTLVFTDKKINIPVDDEVFKVN